MKVDKKFTADLNDLPVEKFRDGDEKVFRRLFTALFPVVCSFAAKFLPASEAPEDIVQEAFIECWDQRAKFTGLDHIKSFLYLTARNKCLNKIKHVAVKNKYIEENTRDLEGNEFFENQLFKAEIALHFREAIGKLPRQQRKIILLNMIGHSNDEIAGTLEISVNTVKLQKKVAYEKLRKKLRNTVYGLIFL